MRELKTSQDFRVSVCVATRNRCRSLASLLEGLQQRIAASRIRCEVIVVDNGSSDETARTLAPYAALEHHQHMRLARPGKSRALNAAIAAARGELLAFLDDDEMLSPDWPEPMVAFLDERTEYAAAVGRVLPPPDADPELVARARAWRTLTLFDEGEQVRDTDTLVGGNMMLRREVFDAVGTFDERLGPGAAGGFEDQELSRRMVAAGMKIGYVPAAVVYHRIDEARMNDRFLREYKLRAARSVYADDPRAARRKAITRLLTDVPAYPLRAVLGPRLRRRAKARLIENAEILRLALGGRASPMAERRARGGSGAQARFALVNLNTRWGGGEKWFAQTADALAAKGRPLLLIGTGGSPLHARFAATGQPTVSPAELARALPEYRPAVVLFNSRKNLSTVRRSMSRDDSARLVLFRGIARPLHDNFVRRRTWRALSHILVNSDATREAVQGSLRWFPKDRMTRIYHQVPFQPDPPVPAANGTFRIGSVSRLVPAKAVDQLIAALALLPADLSWELLIAGEGPCRRRLETLVDESGLTDRCRFIGHCDDVASVYAQLDVVAIPSLYEGFCFTAVEAALAGLPVVASGVTALTEVVLDERTGLLVPPKDPPAIATALIRLARDREWATQLGRAAQLVARERFQGPALIDELDRCLERVAAQKPVGQS